ncbi:unnamed protein product [Nezara viridula]|uniref:Uncharacterized protein n=1 Tax=Nezara viridula TaxID=85310 RepID=A0A9P0HMW1_NEZVI|nr:unnamed protein product [Nezara viridula]
MNLGMYQYGEAYYEEQPYYEEEYSPRYQYHADQYQEYQDQKQEYFQDVNVINGLSYTNLDYQYRCPERPQEYEPCLEYGQQELQFQPVKEEHIFQEQHRLQPPQPAPSIPTYKWMQVKRNVPKPAVTQGRLGAGLLDVTDRFQQRNASWETVWSALYSNHLVHPHDLMVERTQNKTIVPRFPPKKKKEIGIGLQWEY